MTDTRRRGGDILGTTTRAAPRLGPDLRAAIAFADDGAPAAEICRRVGDVAERLGHPRPSYEQVRVLVRAQRALKPDGVTGLQLAWDITWRTRPAWDLEPWLRGEPLPYRRGAHNEPRRPAK